MRTRLALALALVVAAALLWLHGRATPGAPPVAARPAPARLAVARPPARVLGSAPVVASSAPDGKVWLSGHVRDEQGQPVEGARVRALHGRQDEPVEGARLPALEESEATTDASGAFDVAVSPGPVSGEVEAAGFVTAELSVRDSARETAEVTLVRTCALVGRVELATTGAPVAGARVLAVLTDSHDLDSLPTVTTDAHGRFRIEGLAPGRYKPWASTPGRLGQASGSVSLRAGTESEPVVIRLLGVHRVRGAIRKIPPGQPCTNGYVELRASDLHVPSLRAAADPGGRVDLEAIPAGTYSVHVSCSHNVVQASQPLLVARDLDGVVFDFDLDVPLHMDLEARARGHAHGTVVDTRGEPVPDIGFSLRCGSTESTGDTDETGAFRALVPFEPCQVQVRWGDEALTVLEPRAPVSFTPESIREPLRVVVDASLFAFLSGTVSQAGAAVAGARVMAVCDGRDADSAFDGETDAGGQFRVRVRRAGACWMRAWRDEHDSMAAGPVEPDGSLALELQAPGGLRGAVSRPGGAPASLFTVELSPLLHGVELQPRRYETFFGSDGRWQLEGIGPGDYRITAGYGEESTRQEVHVAPGGQGELHLTLEPPEAEGDEAEGDEAEGDEAEASPPAASPPAARPE
ncbi:MAG: carboxypeptidase regulatory-like domain-containing protein [Myxococcales bacterium]|nr:MAG: carboxypeptidase regulatory-like domain-containing protein [Myxococcales bacterium]